MMDLLMMRWPIFGSEATYTEVQVPPTGESITHRYQLLSSDTENFQKWFLWDKILTGVTRCYGQDQESSHETKFIKGASQWAAQMRTHSLVLPEVWYSHVGHVQVSLLKGTWCQKIHTVVLRHSADGPILFMKSHLASPIWENDSTPC
jgi:hypothetical protein